MGINSVTLQDESGRVLEAIDDSRNRLSKLLPQGPGSSFAYLSDIDMYGNTIFNRLQCAKVLREWLALAPMVKSELDAQVVEGVRKLLERAATDVHLYVRFEGD